MEVTTDKVSAELPAPVGGRILRLNGSAGDVVPVAMAPPLGPLVRTIPERKPVSPPASSWEASQCVTSSTKLGGTAAATGRPA